MYRFCLRNPAPTAFAPRAMSMCLGLTLCLAASSGCAHVSPYEREYLARPSMDTADREQAEETFRTHVAEAREGGGGGGSTAGGGCGCN